MLHKECVQLLPRQNLGFVMPVFWGDDHLLLSLSVCGSTEIPRITAGGIDKLVLLLPMHMKTNVELFRFRIYCSCTKSSTNKSTKRHQARACYARAIFISGKYGSRGSYIEQINP